MKKTQYILSLIAALLSSVIIIAQTEVGTLPGAVSVSPSGAATYTMPIELPEGRAGMNPSLALTYNSQGGNGLLGMGWNLTDLSAISRTGQSIYHDDNTGGVNLDDDDRFALDGQRLILVERSVFNISNNFNFIHFIFPAKDYRLIVNFINALVNPFHKFLFAFNPYVL